MKDFGKGLTVGAILILLVALCTLGVMEARQSITEYKECKQNLTELKNYTAVVENTTIACMQYANYCTQRFNEEVKTNFSLPYK